MASDAVLRARFACSECMSTPCVAGAPAPKFRDSWGRGLAAVVLVNGAIRLLACLGIELGVQALFPRDLRAVFNDPAVFLRKRPFVVPDESRGFALKPGYAEGNIHVDSAGFRGPELPAD